MRIGGNVPGGLVYNRNPVVWLAQHPDGPVLTIERMGPACAVTWRPYAHHRAPFYEAMVCCDSTDYETNLAAAESYCVLFMEGPAPEHMLPKNVKQDQRAREEVESRETAAPTGPGGGRRRKTDDEKRAAKAKRQQRWRDNARNEDLPERWLAAFNDVFADLSITDDRKLRPRMVLASGLSVADVDAWAEGRGGANVNAWLLTSAARDAFADFCPLKS